MCLFFARGARLSALTHCMHLGPGRYHQYSSAASLSGGDAAAARPEERLYLAILNDHAQHWPGLCCWWCTNEIPKEQQPLPLAMRQRRVVRTARSSLRTTSGYQWHGFFCCVACVKAFCVSRQVPFSPTRMFLAEIGVMPWRVKSVVAAPNYLDQRKFGPGTFRTSSHKYRMQAVCLKSPQARPISSRLPGGGADCGGGGENKGGPRAASPLRRKRRRHGGNGTLVPWLGGVKGAQPAKPKN